MRMTIHNARANKLGAFTPKHNDRNFDVSHADHIDPERMPGNIYWNWTGKNISFEDAEKEFYELHCREHLDAVNRRYREQRHPERVRDMDTYRTARQTCPEETLLMIGNKNEYLPPRTLRAICEKLKDWEENTIPGLKVLDMALHVDEEGAPHIHMRKAWLYSDKNGEERISQGKTLEAAGIPLPHPDKPQGRNNNRKQTFSNMERAAFYEICRSYGLENLLETKPLERSKTGQELTEYQARQAEERVIAASAQIKAIEQKNSHLLRQLQERERAYTEIQQELQHLKTEYAEIQNFLHKTEQRRAFEIFNRELERTR